MKPTKYKVRLREHVLNGYRSVVDLSDGSGKAIEGRNADVYLTSEVDPLLTHRWVPIAECGELRAGLYVSRLGEMRLLADGSWVTNFGGFTVGTSAPTHILSPWMGPLPEARES